MKSLLILFLKSKLAILINVASKGTATYQGHSNKPIYLYSFSTYTV
jgi:hypothetical protein